MGVNINITVGSVSQFVMYVVGPKSEDQRQVKGLNNFISVAKVFGVAEAKCGWGLAEDFDGDPSAVRMGLRLRFGEREARGEQ